MCIIYVYLILLWRYFFIGFKFVYFHSLAITSRNGTCFSTTECRDKGGQAAGGCAAG